MDKRQFLGGLAAAGAATAASAQETYTPKRHNKVVELFEAGQPIYYVGADPRKPGYEQGKALAGTWADAINWEMEHGTFDLANLRAFMQGWSMAAPPAAAIAFQP